MNRIQTAVCFSIVVPVHNSQSQKTNASTYNFKFYLDTPQLFFSFAFLIPELRRKFTATKIIYHVGVTQGMCTFALHVQL